MGSRSVLAPGEFYHVYNRGTERRSIFLSEIDYNRFLALLYLSNGTETIHISNHQGRTLMDFLLMEKGAPLVDIASYCLMPNHFHLLLRQRDDRGISRFMQKLTTGYTMYFNINTERTGTLFQGKFKSEHAGTDRYLRYLISYIHLNPIKLIEPKWRELGLRDDRKARRFLHGYRYSSFLDYAGTSRLESKIVDCSVLPYHFSPQEFIGEVFEWLEIGQNGKVEP